MRRDLSVGQAFRPNLMKLHQDIIIHSSALPYLK